MESSDRSVLPESLLSRLSRPALYRKNETFGNPDWAQAGIRVLIVRLSSFDDVAQSFSHLFLAQETRRGAPDGYVDFSFLPNRADRRMLLAAGASPFFGVQSHHRASSFDLLLVSCSYLLELVNLPWLLSADELPPYSSGRSGPLVILGGSALLSATAVIGSRGEPTPTPRTGSTPGFDTTRDAIPDALFFGEGERRVERIVHELADVGAGKDRLARLRELSLSIDGLWVVGGDRSVVLPARADRIETRDLAADYPVLPGAQARTARLQISYGCPYRCSFCFEGNTRRPYRPVDLNVLFEAARLLKRNVGATRLELSSYNFNSYDAIAPLLLGCNGAFEEVSLMSQRPDVLNRREGLIDLELAGEKRSFTLGIEGISERLRAFLDKGLRTAHIIEVIEKLSSRGVREIKLFFVVTGYEADADFSEFDGLCRRIASAHSPGASRIRVIVSANRLVRMPFTPLQYDPILLDRSRWDGLFRRLKQIVDTHGFQMRDEEPWSDYVSEQLIASGTPAVHHAILEIAERGIVFDGSMPEEAARILMETVPLSSSGPSAASVVTEPTHIGDGEGMEALKRRYLRLVSHLEGPEDPRKTAGSVHAIEETPPRVDDSREATSTLRVRRTSGDTRYSGIPHLDIVTLDELVRARRRLSASYFAATLPPAVAGMGADWTASWICRALARDCPELSSRLISAQEALWMSLWGDDIAWYGRSVIAVAAVGGATDLLSASRPAWIGAAIESFEPKVLRSAHVRLVLPLGATEDPERRVSRYLVASHAPATVRRLEDGWYGLEVGERARKAKVVFGGRYRRNGDTFEAELVVGRRFSPREMIVEIGGVDRRDEALYQATIEVQRIEPFALNLENAGSRAE